VKDKRPINLDITTIKFPLAAIASILHRVSGIGLFFGVGILLYFLQISLRSEGEFERVAILFDGLFMTSLLGLILLALIYHLVAGIKHLLLDLGVGESKQAAKTGTIIMWIMCVLVTGFALGLLW
jgi:succinate dehydrogenase / fumarate reductase cytochrome b subunit